MRLTTNQYPITPRCRLRGVLHEAMDAFMGVLDGRPLADLLSPADFGIKGAA